MEFNLLTNWAQSNVEQVVFYILAITAIPLAFGVVLDRTIIRSGFLLIGVFAVIAGLFFLQQAQFLALAQVMIYGVGITLVVVIALMLTNPKQESETSPGITQHTGPAAFVAALVFMCVYLSLRSAENWPLKLQGQMPDAAANIKVLGIKLMTYYSLPFEFASILLLAALIGAVMLAKAEQPERVESDETDRENNKDSSERSDDVVKV